ncbi:MAG: L-ascorbate metabolism protein UlaG (beta-lactamase superfamily) [Psychroserpens sp.]|jgi:L-ascorbate metabolism protein UlaG (beta-lactamase superfamily)
MKSLILVLSIFSSFLTGCKEAPKEKSVEPMSKEAAPAKTAQELKIVPIEHASTVLEWGNLTIYVDPVGGALAYEGQKQPDLILITDIHGDHFSLETLQELNTEKAKIMVPQAVADKMPAEFAPQLDILNNGESKERYGITVEAIPMYNLRKEALQMHPKGRGNGYILNMGDKRIYFSGDTEDIPEMRVLENIDTAFICMNLPYTMTEDSAADAVLEFKPKEVYPYHYRGNPDVSDVEKFQSIIETGNPEIKVIQLDWYPKEAY